MFKAHLPWVEIFGVTQNCDYSLVGKTKDLDGNARGISNEWRGSRRYDLYDHRMGSKIANLKINKMFVRAP